MKSSSYPTENSKVLKFNYSHGIFWRKSLSIENNEIDDNKSTREVIVLPSQKPKLKSAAVSPFFSNAYGELLFANFVFESVMSSAIGLDLLFQINKSEDEKYGTQCYS